MGDHTEYHVLAWVQTTGDRNNAPIPGKHNINQERPGWDNEGRAYEYDFHGDAESGVAYKKHPVSSTVKPWWNRVNPWAEQVIRNFDLSIYCFYMDIHPNNPDNLAADPHVISEISGDSNQYLNIGLGTASISAP